jgi:hypothetical protein
MDVFLESSLNAYFKELIGNALINMSYVKFRVNFFFPYVV